MASTIDDTSIDATFPVAGQDNNSQGFRDNFNTIKSNFVAAKSEITTLQTTRARLDSNNDFAGNEINGALFKGNFTKHHPMGSQTTDENISVANGNFQTITVGSNITLTLTDFSNQNEAFESVVVSILKSGGDRTITFAVNGGTLKKDANMPDPFIADSTTNPRVVEFFSYDKGVTVFARYVGQFS